MSPRFNSQHPHILSFFTPSPLSPPANSFTLLPIHPSTHPPLPSRNRHVGLFRKSTRPVLQPHQP
ncbi:MAG: hypothetical protein AAGH78_04725, partial [Cyanobacteria bacterium P01_H01_bin.58]